MKEREVDVHLCVSDSTAAAEQQFKVHSGCWSALDVPVLEPASLMSLIVSQYLWVKHTCSTSKSRPTTL